MSQLFSGISIVALYPLINYALEKPAATQKTTEPAGPAAAAAVANPEPDKAAKSSGIADKFKSKANSLKGGAFEKKLERIPFYIWMKGSTLRYFAVYSSIPAAVPGQGADPVRRHYMMARVSIT